MLILVKDKLSCTKSSFGSVGRDLWFKLPDFSSPTVRKTYLVTRLSEANFIPWKTVFHDARQSKTDRPKKFDEVGIHDIPHFVISSSTQRLSLER